MLVGYCFKGLWGWHTFNVNEELRVLLCHVDGAASIITLFGSGFCTRRTEQSTEKDTLSEEQKNFLIRLDQ